MRSSSTESGLGVSPGVRDDGRRSIRTSARCPGRWRATASTGAKTDAPEDDDDGHNEGRAGYVEGYTRHAGGGPGEDATGDAGAPHGVELGEVLQICQVRLVKF